MKGGTPGGLYDGRLAPAVPFTLDGVGYNLWAAEEDAKNSKTKVVKVKVARADGTGPVVVLDPAKFIGARAAARMTALQQAANALRVEANKQGQKGAAIKPALQTLLDLQKQVVAAAQRVKASIEAYACTALGAGCFAAGTKLLTPAGWRNVEDLRAGDYVLARAEDDPLGPAEQKRVEDVFRRTGRVLHLHAGGRVVRTTPEHPFWVDGKGWTAAGALRPGDRVGTLDGPPVAVEEAYDTGVYAPVYNLRVADHRTYFVGDHDWAFALWAHNTYEFISGLKTAEEALTQLGSPPTRAALASANPPPIAAAIFGAVRAEPKYGGVGSRTQLVRLLVDALRPKLDPSDVPPPQGDAAAAAAATAATQGYLRTGRRPAVRLQKEAEIDGLRRDKIAQAEPAISFPKTNVTNWAGYIFVDKDNSDARGARFQDVYVASLGKKPHGHHIVYKDSGSTSPAGLAASQAARDVLLYFDINPYWDVRNLAYAPKWGHPVRAIEYIRDQLMASFANGIDPSTPGTGVVAVLKEMAKQFIDQTLPGMKNGPP